MVHPLKVKHVKPLGLWDLSFAQVIHQPRTLPPPETRPYSGLINHWFPLIRPYQTLISAGGTLGGGGG